jgi:glycosyltransferase involved in cell wall biosynthesis
MENKPFFSIIIPTYNRATLLKKTLESIIKQTFEAFEVIVVDDGGKDNSQQIVENLQCEKIRYYWKENAERGAARNYGANLAKGSWLNFFDSDDIAYPNHLSDAYAFIEQRQELNVFHTNYDHKDTDLNPIRPPSAYINDDILNEKIIVYNPLSCNNVFLKKEIFNTLKFEENRTLSGSEDWLLWLQLAARYPIYACQALSSVIIEHGGRSMVTASGKNTLDRGTTLLNALKNDDIFMKKYASNLPIIAAEMLSLSALNYALEANKSQGASLLIQSLISNPYTLFNRRTLAIIKHLLFKKKLK